MVGRNCLELLRGIVVFDTTTLLTEHIVSSHTDLILGYHVACSRLLLGIANSVKLKCCSVSTVGCQEIILILVAGNSALHVALETIQSTGTEMRSKFCNNGTRPMNYCVMWY